MKKEYLDDLEYMRRIREREERLFREDEENKRRLRKIEMDGIRNMDDVEFWLKMEIWGAKNLSHQARDVNNQLMYVESIGVIREMTKLLQLVYKGKGNRVTEEREDYDMEVM